MLQFIRRRPIMFFTALVMFLTYAIGLPWAFATSDLERSLGLPEEFLSLGLMRAAPTLAGLVVLTIIAGFSGARIWFRQLLRWRVHPGYYAALAFIVLAPFLVTVAATVPEGRFFSSPDVAPSRDWVTVVASYLREIAYITLTNGEETGWRFALLGLLLARMPVFHATVIVGVIWALWHMPAFFLFGQGPSWYPLIGICMAWSVLYAWLYLRTGSLLLTVLAHGGANASFYSFERLFPDLYSHWERLGPAGDWIFAAAGCAIAAVVLIANRSLFFARFTTRDGEDWAHGVGVERGA